MYAISIYMYTSGFYARYLAYVYIYVRIYIHVYRYGVRTRCICRYAYGYAISIYTSSSYARCLAYVYIDMAYVYIDLAYELDVYVDVHTDTPYGVATISRLLRIIGLFCRIQSLLQGSFAKETYHCKEPTNCSHTISICTFSFYARCLPAMSTKKSDFLGVLWGGYN